MELHVVTRQLTDISTVIGVGEYPVSGQ